MSDFTPYVPEVPERISQVRISIYSFLKEDRDEFGEPTGTFTESEAIEAEAVTVDADGIVVKGHMTTDPQVLVSNGIFTAQQLLTIQDWIRVVRDNAEAVLLPAP